MKKTGMIALIVGGALALGGGSVYASNQIARSTAIGEQTATSFALVDAGVKPEDAKVTQAHFDFENGRFVYDIDFTAGGVKYEYTIDSQSGEVMERSSEKLPVSSATKPTQTPATTPAAPAQQNTGSAAQNPANAAPTATSKDIGVDSAKEIALANAGLAADGVVFSKAYQEREDGILVYEIEFIVPGEAEYDYEINAVTGAIRASEVDRVQPVNAAGAGTQQTAPAQPEQTGSTPPAQTVQPAPTQSTPPAQTVQPAPTQAPQTNVAQPAPQQQPTAPAQTQYWDDDYYDDYYDDYDDYYDDYDDRYDDYDDDRWDNDWDDDRDDWDD